MNNYHAIMKAFSLLAPEYDNLLVPMKQTNDFDLIGVEICLLNYERIKVIYTNYKNANGYYEANLRSSGGYSKSNSHKKDFDNTSCESLFVVTPEHCYWIPSEIIKAKRAISLNKYTNYIIGESSSVG